MRLLVLALLCSGAAFAQAPAGASQGSTAPNAPALAPVAETFRADLQTIGRLATAAARIHERDGVFPASPFALLGDAEAERAGARALPLRSIAITADGKAAQIVAEPLPTDPYTPERTRFTITVEERADGRYDVRHEITRAHAPEAGGAARPYAVSGTYRVERAFGTLCVDPARPEGLVRPDVRVTPLGAPSPVFFAASGDERLSACGRPASDSSAAMRHGTAAESR